MRGLVINDQGFSLVELLVTMGVLAFVIGGVYSTSIVQSKNVKVTNDVGKVQQNIRMATGMVERDLRFAGYGVGDGNIKNSMTNAMMPALKITNSNPDRIDLVYIDVGSKLTVDKQMPNTSAVIKIDPADPPTPKGYKPGDVIIITDGEHMDLMGITSINDTDAHIGHNTGKVDGVTLNTNKNLSTSYGPGAFVFKAYQASYYIDSGNLVIDPDSSGPKPAEILVPNIETLEALAGVDLNGDNQVDSTEWKSGDYDSGADDLIAVQLSLSSLSPSLDPDYMTNAVTVGDQTLPAGLNHRRRLYTRTVNLRNLARR